MLNTRRRARHDTVLGGVLSEGRRGRREGGTDHTVIRSDARCESSPGRKRRGNLAGAGKHRPLLVLIGRRRHRVREKHTGSADRQ